MKILYAIQGTGNGHISRAMQIRPYLQGFGEVDYFLSGQSHSLKPNFEIKYKSKGMGLYFKECGSIDLFKTVLRSKYLQVLKEARDLPVEKYDLVINDFDHITALACRNKQVKSIQFGHQASFYSPLTPRPSKRDFFGELVLKHYAKADTYVGLHFRPYDTHIYTPIVKEAILHASPRDKGHTTVYLSTFDSKCMVELLGSIPEMDFHMFCPDIKQVHRAGNIKFFPIDPYLFDLSLVNCNGIITSGGFETPSEALYLNKKVLSVPIKNHYEQNCNAAALAELGVMVKDTLNKEIILDFLDYRQPKIEIIPNNIEETLAAICKRSPANVNLM